MKILGNVDATPAQLPSNLAGFIDKPVEISRPKLQQAISATGLTEAALGGSLDAPVSRGNSNNPHAPEARYFVIHDTSSPNFGNVAQFPADIDTKATRSIRLDGFKSASNAKAHIFLNRRGEIYVGHDFAACPGAQPSWNCRSEPWRVACSFTSRTIRPRRKHPSQPDGNAPMPGFSPAQYDRLALLYLMASVRAHTGLVPAFHAAIDQGMSDGHDDPQNFSLEDFDAAFGLLLASVK